MLPSRAVSSISSGIARSALDGIPGTASTADCEPHGVEDGPDPACRVVLDRSERMAIRANPAKKGIRLRLMIHDRVLQLIFLLPPIDKPMSPSSPSSCLCGPPSGMCSQVRSGPRSVGPPPSLCSQNDADRLLEPNKPCLTPEKLPVSSRPTRMTRGKSGSLLLHCNGLAPSTPCRSPGAPCSGLFRGSARSAWPITPIKASTHRRRMPLHSRLSSMAGRFPDHEAAREQIRHHRESPTSATF
ncbi:hypothetical protein ACVWWG_001985 [Bradyrhizobium sp. LB7.2]